MQLEIRQAETEDADQVSKLVADFVSSFDLDLQKFNESYQHLTADNQAAVFVAESNGSIVGYCLGFVHDTFFANGPVAWVEEIMVQSDIRRSSVGEQLMTEFELWARERGAVLSALATRRASDFYRALGYQESATYFRRVF